MGRLLRYRASLFARADARKKNDDIEFRRARLSCFLRNSLSTRTRAAHKIKLFFHKPVIDFSEVNRC